MFGLTRTCQFSAAFPLDFSVLVSTSCGIMMAVMTRFRGDFEGISIGSCEAS